MNRAVAFRALRHFFVTIAVLILISLGLDVLFSKFIVANLSESTNVGKIRRLIYHADPGEIPIFGSSITRRNYFPDSLSFDVYNYGMPGALYTSIEPLIQIELDKPKDTPILIDFDQHTFFLDNYSRIQVSNYIPFIENNYIEQMLRNTGTYDWHYKVPGMRYYGSTMDYIRDFMKPHLEREEIASKGGVFFPNRPKVYEQFKKRRENMIAGYKVLKEKQEHSPMLMTIGQRKELTWLDMLLNFHPDSGLVKRFETLVALHPHRLFVLVYPPQNELKREGSTNGEQVYLLLKQIESDHANIAVIDFSKYYFAEKYYKDSGHMNIDGARHFSGLLNEELKRVLADPITYSYVSVRDTLN